MKIYLLFLLVTVSACDRSNEQATAYLHSLGYRETSCTSMTEGVATCLADHQQFRCVMTDFRGLYRHHDTACERFYTERPAP